MPRFTVPTLSVPITWHGNAYELPDDAPQTDVDTLAAALATFDRSAPTPEEARLAGERVEWLRRNWANRTPAEIQALIEERIAGITTLAQAKAVLQELLPLMGWAIAAIAHREFER